MSPYQNPSMCLQHCFACAGIYSQVKSNEINREQPDQTHPIDWHLYLGCSNRPFPQAALRSISHCPESQQCQKDILVTCLVASAARGHSCATKRFNQSFDKWRNTSIWRKKASSGMWSALEERDCIMRASFARADRTRCKRRRLRKDKCQIGKFLSELPIYLTFVIGL